MSGLDMSFDEESYGQHALDKHEHDIMPQCNNVMKERSRTAMESENLPILRIRVVKFLIQSAHDLEVAPIVKYSAMSLFADRFYRSLSGFTSSNGSRNWLLQPITESNLQLFALVSLWISSKLHTSHPLSIKLLKSFGDKMIKEQHFMTRDLLDAEVIFMQILKFEIGTANITFIFLEELLIQFKEVAKVGELVNWEACMDIMDLLYEKEETSVSYSSPCSLAAAILVASYLITVPVQEWEFPVFPWVQFVMPFIEEDTVEQVRDILLHVLETDG